MIRLTISRKNKPTFHVLFPSIADARAFTEFEKELVANVKAGVKS